MKQALLDNLKNLRGFRTKRKIVVLSVDDYGAVTLDSVKAMNKLALNYSNDVGHFHKYDSLETKSDLEALYDVLNSVKDINNKPAVFTPFAIPCNINFEKVIADKTRYYHETLPETFEKLSSRHPNTYTGAWEIWKQGLNEGLMKPQFHGREHLHIGIFESWLEKKNPLLLSALENRSFAFTPNSPKKYHSVGAAFGFDHLSENKQYEEVIIDGLNRFEEVFGYRANHFNAPAGVESKQIHGYLKENGIDYIDQPLIKKEHLGGGKFKKEINYTGKKNRHGQTYIVRNVIFEPAKHPNADNVGKALKQVEAAFRWNKPANISSHRVNYCGHIDPQNRRRGLAALKELLQRIVKKWPDVEFMGVDEMVRVVEGR